MLKVGVNLRKERERLDKLHALHLRNISAEKTLEMMADMNRAMQKLGIERIRREYPNVGGEELVKKLRELFRG